MLVPLLERKCLEIYALESKYIQFLRKGNNFLSQNNAYGLLGTSDTYFQNISVKPIYLGYRFFGKEATRKQTPVNGRSVFTVVKVSTVQSFHSSKGFK